MPVSEAFRIHATLIGHFIVTSLLNPKSEHCSSKLLRIEAFQVFAEELSNWYLRRSRRRFWKSEPGAYQTLHRVLATVTRVLAPALPFLTETFIRIPVVASINPF